jgi:polyisoprenoid-binding protein YceI
MTSILANEFKSTSDGFINFEAIGKPAMIKIKGEGPPPKSELLFSEGKVSLTSELQLDQLKTGIDLRDEHMHEKYLETKKYPKAKIIISPLNLPIDWLQKPRNLDAQEFSGTLFLHGKESPIKGTFKINESQVVEAEFKIKLSDYDIEIPNYLGIKVAELVTVKTKIRFE